MFARVYVHAAIVFITFYYFLHVTFSEILILLTLILPVLRLTEESSFIARECCVNRLCLYCKCVIKNLVKEMSSLKSSLLLGFAVLIFGGQYHTTF